MGLSGVDPNDPTPSTRRELIFGAGPGSSGVQRDVLLLGQATVAGSETDDELNEAIADDQDARDRLGERSELYAMYRKYVEIDTGANIHFIAVPDPAGTASSCTITATTASDANSSVEIDIHGETVNYSIAIGDAVGDTATGITAAINDHDGGSLQVSASALAGVVTVTTANTGIRTGFLIGTGATQGLRVSIKTAGAVNAQTLAKGTIIAGVGEDDGSAAIALASQKDSLYWLVSPWHTITAGGAADARSSAVDVSPTDNQTGELIDMIRTQNLPINSKEKVMVAGLGSINANAILVPGDADVNSTRAYFYWQENNDWTPAMIAAHHAAVMRANHISHPSANLAGYTQSDNTPYKVPKPEIATDAPTATEIRTALNNGVSPISFAKGDRPFIVRSITSRHLNAASAFDYKAREGHITIAIDFVWEEIKQRWESQKQPFVADNPPLGQLPTLATSTPRQLQKLIFKVIDDMTSSKPLGIYDGPILSPDAIQQMKDSVVVTKIAAGLSVIAEFIVVQHLLKFEGKFLEVGEAY